MQLSKFASLATAMVLMASVPAFAQMGSGAGDSTSSMSNSKGMSDTAMPTTCQGMMDKAAAMPQPADPDKMAMAKKSMDMAKADMAADHETMCMKHMKTAMHYMM